MNFVHGVVTRIKSYGAFIETSDGISGLVHISDFSDGYVKDISDYIQVGERSVFKILEYDRRKKKYRLSYKIPHKDEITKNNVHVICLNEGFSPFRKQLPNFISQTIKELD